MIKASKFRSLNRFPKLNRFRSHFGGRCRKWLAQCLASSRCQDVSDNFKENKQKYQHWSSDLGLREGRLTSVSCINSPASVSLMSRNVPEHSRCSGESPASVSDREIVSLAGD
ncbi:UNVERIFIED_CONTAM: hypothetical protein K2H54_010765 [Gekko kuhli]